MLWLTYVGEFGISNVFVYQIIPATQTTCSLLLRACNDIDTKKSCHAFHYIVKMAQGTFVEAKVTNIEIKSHALLEIANGMHSPICPNLVEFSTCVPPDDFHMVIWASMKVPWLEPFLIMKCLATFFFVSIQSRNTQMSFKPRYVSKNLLQKIVQIFPTKWDYTAAFFIEQFFHF